MKNTAYEVRALKTLKEHTSPELALADWALGLGGEFGEVLEIFETGEKIDKMEFAKELGDVLWYTFALSKEIGFVLPLELTAEISSAPINLGVAIGKCQETVKHMVCHKEGIEVDALHPLLTDVLAGLIQLSSSMGISLRDVAELNVSKLEHRYGGKEYSKKASSNRKAAEVAFESTPIYEALVEKICKRS